MFKGDDPGLSRVMGRGFGWARELGHPRVGSEHLLLALTQDGGKIADVLARHGATTASVRAAVCAAAPLGAGAAADRELLGAIDVDLESVLGTAGTVALDRPTGPQPVLPLGAARARRRVASLNPPLGIDAQACYETSLRLALARRERQHRSEHLALTLVTLDPGVAWVLTHAEVGRPALCAELAAVFPPPTRNLLLRAERHLGHRARHRDIVRRYQRLTGRSVVRVIDQ